MTFVFTSIISLPISSTPSLCQPSAVPPRRSPTPMNWVVYLLHLHRSWQCRWLALGSHGPQTQSGCQFFPGINLHDSYHIPLAGPTSAMSSSILKSLNHLPPSYSASDLDFYSTNQMDAMTRGFTQLPDTMTSTRRQQASIISPFSSFFQLMQCFLLLLKIISQPEL